MSVENMGQVTFVESAMFVLTLLYSVTGTSSNEAGLSFFCCLVTLNMGATMCFWLYQVCLGLSMLLVSLSTLTIFLLELVAYNFFLQQIVWALCCLICVNAIFWYHHAVFCFSCKVAVCAIFKVWLTDLSVLSYFLLINGLYLIEDSK